MHECRAQAMRSRQAVIFEGTTEKVKVGTQGMSLVIDRAIP